MERFNPLNNLKNFHSLKVDTRQFCSTTNRSSEMSHPYEKVSIPLRICQLTFAGNSHLHPISSSTKKRISHRRRHHRPIPLRPQPFPTPLRLAGLDGIDRRLVDNLVFGTARYHEKSLCFRADLDL